MCGVAAKHACYGGHSVSATTSSTRADLVLALDSGSQSSRALLFDREGSVLAEASARHQAMRYPQPGAVEQDPADIRACLFDSIARCLRQWGGDPHRIAAASLTTQRGVYLALDEKGSPLRPAISWLDRRTADVLAQSSLPLRMLLRLFGADALVPRLMARSMPRQWRGRDPELLSELRWIVPLEAWLNFELCSRLALAPGGLAGVLPVDVKKRRWAGGRLLYFLLGYRREWLPEVVEAGERIGVLSEAAAEATGLSPGLPIISCGGDKQSEALGIGVRSGRRDLAVVSLGTASSVAIASKVPRSSSSYRWLTIAAAERASWQLEYMVFRGFWTVRWFAREVARDLSERAEREGKAVEALLDEEALSTPAGAEGLVVWPRWSPSLQEPGETGVLVGLREVHGRGHMYRALLEGIAMDLRRGAELLEQVSGDRIQEFRVGGGGSQSTLAVQILADVLGRPVRRPESVELSARGAAIVAAVAVGLHPSIDAAVDAMVPESPLVLPDPDRVALYDRLYKEVFEPGLAEMRGVFAGLRQL